MILEGKGDKVLLECGSWTVVQLPKRGLNACAFCCAKGLLFP